jgi:AmmeMemoRadiSam system protein B/AmmeMemoRadiSam system protein A
MKKLIAIGAITILIITGILFAKLKLSKKDAIINKMEKNETSVRQPAAAGTFYPADPAELQRKITQYLSESESIIDNSKSINLLIVPHAGYEYSGPVAATGFRQIENRNYDKVILLGASHQAYFDGIAVDENTAWKTPLGQVEIDLTTAQKIVDSNDRFYFNSQAHLQEHSLEVEVPFLQTVLDSFKIVPILLGQTTDKDLENLADIISQNLNSTTLIVISTDLSHYPNYEIANSVDERTINAILTGDPEKFEEKVNEQLSQNYPNLDTCACGEKAVKVGMIAAQKIEGNWQLLKYANSGDAIGEKSRVVGYGALAFLSKPATRNSEQQLTDSDKQKLLSLARQTLESYIKKGEQPNYNATLPYLENKLGAFVTLRKNGQLRGCMGEFEPTTPLWQTIIDRTIVAATQDPRFSPVKPEEIDDITIEISVLSKPEHNSWENVKLGTHGVLVKKGNRGGTYLPQVGTENEWNGVEDFLSHLCQNKAGLPKNCYKNPDTEFLTYTADVFSE